MYIIFNSDHSIELDKILEREYSVLGYDIGTCLFEGDHQSNIRYKEGYVYVDIGGDINIRNVQLQERFINLKFLNSLKIISLL